MRTSITARSLQAGLSMVELMVAMVIALIGTIIMFQVFEVSEGIKRTTTSGGDAQQNGVVGLYVLENDLRNAGMGFSDTAGFNACTVLAYDQPPSGTGRDFTLRLAPVQITSGGNSRTPDQLTVFYGSQHVVGAATTLASNMTATSADPIRVINAYGFRTGDLIVLMEPGGAAATKNCSMWEVTALPGENIIQHGTGSYALNWLGSNPTKSARANKGGGLGVLYGGAGSGNATKVFNLGNVYDRDGNYTYNGSSMPVYNTYAVTNKTLTVASAFTTAPATAVVDNIVHMRVVYGLDDGTSDATAPWQTTGAVAGDGRVDRFVDGAKFVTVGSPWSRVIAVRIVLVARSTMPEKSTDPALACNATTSAPTWSGSGWAGQMTALDLSGDPDWQCYRYKVFETTTPLRNWIWRSS